MPSKIKSNAIAAGSAGFLKPTFSSLNKAVDKNGNRIPNFLGTKDEIANENKKQTLPKVVERTKNVTDPIVLPAVVKESPLHSSTSVTDTCHSNSSSKPVHPDVAVENQKNTEEACNNLVQALSSSLNFDEPVNNANDTKIRDARKVCDELREQIDHLKKQQQMFVTRLSGEFNEMENLDKSKTDFIKKANGIIDDPSILCQNCDQNDDGDGNAFGEGHGTEPDFGKNTVPVPIVLGTRSHKPILMKKVDYKSPSLSSEDGFNLHGSMMSDVTDSMMSDVTDFFVKDEWVSSRGLPKDVPPAKVIKRLMSERERYKKKVKHLQQALHKLKKQSQMGSFGRTPDIAAHDIVYFNADLIGEGYLSYVYSGTIYKNQKAAIKKLIRPDMMSTSDRSYLAAEAGLLMALHHQNIVEVFGVSTAPLQPLVITELVKGRNLSDRLHSSDGWPLSPVEYYSIVRDITVGMAYLHGQKPPVLHLNLRPCNVLLESNGRAKVADFGFSKIRLDAGMSNRANISYLAPELLQFPVHLTTKLDVYSYAMILWEMSTMTTPYKDTSISEILASVSSGKRMNIPCELPSGFHAVISRSWDQSPMQRPSFKELIIVLETMTLPQDWDDAIERSGLNRTDTRGLVTPRDDSNQDKSKISVGYFMPTTNKNKDAPQYSHPIPNGDQKVSQVENNINKERKKLSDELALESDMMTLGYNLPKPDQPHRTESSDYLRGFKRSEPIPHYNYHPASPQQKHTSNRRSLSAQLSPYKYNMINGSPVITHFHHRSRKNGNHERTPDSRRITYSGEEIHPHFKAARNLDQELSLHYDVRSPSKLNGHAPTYSPSENRRSKPNYYGEKYKKSNGRHERPKYGSQSSSETDNSIDVTKHGDTPQPLTDRDMRFHNQDLTVETPKIVSRRSDSNNNERKYKKYPERARSPEESGTAASGPHLEANKLGNSERPYGRKLKNKNKKSRNHDIEPSSQNNQDDLGAAVAIPYLKNLRSGDESVSTSSNGTQRSHFDDKLSSYVSDACQAESRSYVDSRMKGWHSSRSAILNKEPGPPSSDYIKVRSIGTTVADQSQINGQNRNNPQFSETSGSLMTAVYKPNEARRKELYDSTGRAKNGDDDVISPTVSENTIDETNKIVVKSVTSSLGTHTGQAHYRPHHSGGPPRRSRHASEDRIADSNNRSVNPKLLRRENSWNKLKNSYSPEPLMPHFHSPFGTPEHSSNIILPPALNSSDVRERPSAFSKPTHNPSRNGKRKGNRNSQSERTQPQYSPISRGWPLANPVPEHISIDSSPTSDEVGDALNDTARELAGVSEILGNAAEQHKRDRKGHKSNEKKKKRESE